MDDGSDGPLASEHLDARYRSLFFDHPHAVFSLGLDGCFVEANRAAARLSGYEAGELVGMSMSVLVEPHDLARAEAAFAAALDQQPQRIELAIRRADDAVTEVEVTALPLVVDDQVLGVYGIAEDVTGRNAVARDLEVTRQFAAQASEAKSDFLARASHEIRTPLTGMLAAAELLEQISPTHEQQQLLATLRRAGKRLVALVDNVLDLSPHGLAGELHLRAVCDLHAVLRDAAELADASARLKGLRVTLDVAPSVPYRVLDHPTWTSQILGNLLSNAVNYTERGEVSLSVSASTCSNGAQMLLYRVTDTGPGIEPDQLERIWEPFVRATSSRGVPGAGLGLTVVKQLVTISGGSVTVASEPGQGSTFTVLMPCRAVLADLV